MSTQICSLCGYDFIYPSKLKRHQKSTQCNTSLVCQESSLQCQDIINKDKSWSCLSCGYITKFKQNYNRHVKTCVIRSDKSTTDDIDARTSGSECADMFARFIQENQQLKAIINEQIKMNIQELKGDKPDSKLEVNDSKLEVNNSKTEVNDSSTTNNNSHNTTTNNTNNNNLNLTITNNNTINAPAIPVPAYKYINPVGCEDLSFITEKQLDYIYEDTDNSTGKLLDIIYSKRENRNFTKDNVNKPDMKYYSKRLKVDYMQEYDFVEQLTQQRMLNFHLRLIHTFKHKITLEKFSNYFRRIITIERIFDDFDIEAAKSKSHASAIKSIINQLSRDKRITHDMCEFFKLIEENEFIKAETEARIRFYEKLESSAVVEYETREKLSMELLTENRNLNHFKRLYINQAMIDQQALYDRKAIV